ncbi:MAG TPA: aldolase/citrate lyase family protein [Candidatus Ozemobacteraceae bacterium]|nr:aldolase/citrate lyase family protein [Candidatus Ozemobacteraceae bacterium]
MSTESIFRSGLEGKSDVIVTYEKTDATLEIVVESSVKKLFGRHIRERAEKSCREFGVTKGKLHIKDDGALDYVLMARLEAVFRKAGVYTPAPFKALPRAAGAKERLRRSRLYLPGNQPDLSVNAGLFGGDSNILDLEDSVAPDQKLDARVLVRRTLEMADRFFPQGEIIVRMNPLSGPFGRDDLREIVPAAPHTLLIPKCESVEDIKAVESAVAEIEKASGMTVGRTLFMPLLETARGVMNAHAVATASSRNVALCFGAEDFTRDLGIPRTVTGQETLQARATVVMGSRAAGLDAIDTVFSDVADEKGLYNSALEAKAMGFVGKGVIHPRQIPVVHQAFQPSDAELEEAKKIVLALREAEKTGSGVVALGSKMVDAPVAARARKLIDLARKMNLPGLEEF